MFMRLEISSYLLCDGFDVEFTAMILCSKRLAAIVVSATMFFKYYDIPIQTRERAFRRYNGKTLSRDEVRRILDVLRKYEIFSAAF